ncbi:MAG TPA: hypothetical protein PKO06_10450, partial [Candidatus Ozemobacteraceae bacterium]|nr:hypothetical protein [Candidatus Ozemobacteraceae bacterium]
MRIVLFWVSLIAALATIFAAASGGYLYLAASQSLEAEGQRWGWERLEVATRQLNELCSRLNTGALALANDWNSGRVGPEELPGRLREYLAQTPEALSIGLLFPPHQQSDLAWRHAPFYLQRENLDLETADLLPIIVRPLERITASGTIRQTGTLVVEISRRRVRELLLDLDLGRHAYAFLLDDNGRFIWHPHQELITSGKTIFSYSEETHEASLGRFGRAAVEGQRSLQVINSPLTGLRSWAYCGPVQQNHWSLCLMVSSRDLTAPSLPMQQRLFRVVIYATAALCLLFCAWYLRFEDFADHVWKLGTIVSLVLCLGIAGIWAYTTLYFEARFPGSAPLLETSFLAKIETEHIERSRKQGYDDPLFIPSGLFIQSVEFESAINVKLKGYAWQKYPIPMIASISEGFIFPEAVETSLEKAYEREENGIRTIGWSFSTTLRQSFDYSTYPFDQQNIWIRMWHQDFDRNIVLVPDLNGYNWLNPSMKPGIDEHIILPAWNIEKSYFNYNLLDYNTNFGINSYNGQDRFPELHFNMLIRRRFLDPFMSSIVPLLVVALQMFSVLIISTKKEDLANRMG